MSVSTSPDAAARPAFGTFTDHGVGAEVAECRGIVTTRTSDGRNLVIANALDMGPTGYIVVTDVDSGESTQVYCPEEVPQAAPYASLLASSGRFYTAQGRVLLEFDPAQMRWTFHGTPSPIGTAYLSFTEDPDGIVWAGSVYRTGLISFDPESREMVDHGRMDPAESYLMDLAVDDTGWVYCGIGTARGNIIAYNPATGEKRQLVPEAKRIHETAVVYPTVDGAAFGSAAGASYRLHAGVATEIDPGDAAPRKGVGDIYWGQRTGVFPDGRRVTAYDLPGRWLDLADPATGEVKRIELEYEAGGVVVTSLGRGAADTVYGSTAHPMHFLALDLGARELRDFGPIPAVGGGNFCSIARQGETIVGAQYSSGRLWLYEPSDRWNPTGANPSLEITGSLTIEAWVDAYDLTDYGVIATRGSSAYFFALTGANRVALLIGDGKEWNVVARGKTEVVDGWAHVAATYDAATGAATVYYGGEEDGVAYGRPIPCSGRPAPLSIGSASSYRDTYHFAGAIDELRIYDRVLAPEEIRAHANLEYSPEGLRGHWRFDEDALSAIALDESPYANHGELTNMVPSMSRIEGVLGGALLFDGMDDYVAVETLPNPRWVAQWPDDICRPRAALGHPDGRHVLMSGYAGYGLCGGGIGIYDLETEEATLLTADRDLLPGHSPITLDALPDGDLVGGTSVEAPGGGHPTASEAELFILDWEEKKLSFHGIPVPGDRRIVSVIVGPDSLVYGLSSNGTLFVFDPTTESIVHTDALDDYGAVPRHALHVGHDGRIYAMLARAVLRLTPRTFEWEPLAAPPEPVTAGGALVDRTLAYASGAHVWTYELPPASRLFLPLLTRQHAR